MTEFNWEIFTAVLIPVSIALIPIAIVAVRAFIKKGKCFVLMKKRIEDLEGVAKGSGNTHSDLYNKIETIDKKQIIHGIYLRLILDHLKIPYEK